MELTTNTAPLIIAHRGCSYPSFNQNTIRCFKQVIAEGTPAIEFDVQVTSDGVPVIVHNLDLAEVSTGSGLVCETTFAQIQELYAGKIENGKDPIPTLEDMFVLMAETPEETRPVMHLELKGNLSGKASAELMSQWLADKRLRNEDFFISSFNPGELAVMKEAHPEIERAFLYGAVVRAPLEEQVPELEGQWVTFFNYPEEAYMLTKFTDLESLEPVAAEHIKDDQQRQILMDIVEDNFTGNCYTDAVIDTAEELGCVAINTNWKNTSREFVEKAHARGFKVNCYTINNLDDMKAKVAIGIDGFFTDNFIGAKELFA
ncbi:glycerophosphodiester phosphodiesterase [Sansalvadorimonas verongulae]|uniref:glycerophosphodiester phosphodiesterase n=1 Tax=Sansalvadorimonas verongulae TaxID=2172824 RepID=UPI0012BC8149|nr:glycerophosphodiester phosphodiesterase family protein [Sansalvadorimonas verongulae]MTI12782.1 hypothetical protein [Sansalvadorimonas verongulae]